jgi:hypothetical protein
VSSGSITSGQGTPTITVSGVSAGQSCTATVLMRRLTSSCPNPLRCTTTVSAACPSVSVNCPGEINEGSPAVFSANVSGGDRTAHATLLGGAPQLTYNWSISAGTIKSGQGTPEITIDTTGLGGQTITATLNIGGLPPSCNSTASCSTVVNK